MKCISQHTNCEYNMHHCCIAENFVCKFQEQNTEEPEEDYRIALIKDYKKGMKTKELAEKYNKAIRTVQHIIKTRGQN